MATTADEQPNSWTVRGLGTHGTSVTAIVGAVHRGEPVAVTAGGDFVHTWDLDDTQSGQLLSSAVLETRKARPTALAVVTTGDGSLVFSGWTDGAVFAVNLREDTPTVRPSGPALFDQDTRVLSKATRRPTISPVARSTVQSLAAQADIDGTPRVVCARADSSLSTWRDEESSVPAPHLYGLRADDLPVMVVVLDDRSPGWVYGMLVDGSVMIWDLGGSDEGFVHMPPVLPAGDFTALVVFPGPGRELVRATGGHLDLIRTDEPIDSANPAVDRIEAGVDTITSICALTVGRRAVVAVGGADGRVVLVDPEQRQVLEHAVGLGEPVSALAAIQHEGRDVLLVGGARGGVYVVEPTDTVITDAVELQDDLPGQTRADDRLRRSPLAEALAVRLRRRHEERREASFLVHLDGRWGSGKTTVLNFVAGELGDGWTIVRYNAWRQARVGPPWWTLLTALRSEMMRRRSRFQRAAMWWNELLRQRIRRASGLPATILLLLVAAAVFLIVRPRDAGAGDTLTTVQGVAAALTALATLFAGAQFVARFFGWHSPRGAKAFEDLDANPMDRVAAHFAWLVRTERRPIAFFVDDIDRCNADHVVELLEAVQTLVRDAAESNGDHTLSPCFVVAGDGAWIRNAFEEHYADFAEEIAEPGQPLGYLFLAKIFQLTLPLDRVSPIRQARFFRELLGLDDTGAPPPELVSDASAQIEHAPDDDAQQQVLAALPQDVREAVAPLAVRRQTEKSFATATEHRLTGFAALLPDNPRAVKRFLNAFALTRSVRTVEGQAIPTGTLALWTILEIRWPLLADALSEHPDWVAARGGGDSPTLPPQIPETIRALLDSPVVQSVLAFPDGGPLTPDLIVACRGG